MTAHQPFYPQYVGPPAPKRTTLTRPQLSGHAGALMRQVAKAYKLTVVDLCGPSRSRPICWPRQELMFLLYATGRYSYPEIGRFLGGRDHATVIHGAKAHRRRQAERMAAE